MRVYGGDDLGEFSQRLDRPKIRKETPDHLKTLRGELQKIQEKKERVERAEKMVIAKIDQLIKST